MCVYVYVYLFIHPHSLLYDRPPSCSFCPLPQFTDAGRYLALAAVLLVFAVDKMLVMQQGPTNHIRVNTEMKDDIGYIFLFSVFENETM